MSAYAPMLRDSDVPTVKGVPAMPNQLLEHKADLGTPPSPSPAAPRVAPGRMEPPVPRGYRRRISLRLIVTSAVLVLLLALVGRIGDLLPSLDNPVEKKTVDRSTAPLMLALDDLNQYQAATGTFQLFVDREKDTQYIPSVISGERVSFLAVGSVDAYVDFAALDSDRVRVSEDRRTVSISLPAPELGQARIDPSESRVLDRDRGVLDRIGSALAEDPSVEGEFYAIAQKRMTKAAAKSDVQDRAETNTRQMLTALAQSLGFTSVTVTFDATA